MALDNGSDPKRRKTEKGNWKRQGKGGRNSNVVFAGLFPFLSVFLLGSLLFLIDMGRSLFWFGMWGVILLI